MVTAVAKKSPHRCDEEDVSDVHDVGEAVGELVPGLPAVEGSGRRWRSTRSGHILEPPSHTSFLGRGADGHEEYWPAELDGG